MIQKWIPFWIIPVLMIFAIGTVWLRLSIVRTAYAIHQADRDMDHARQEREQLLLKVSALRSPRRLEVLARTKFGLSQPRMEQVIHLK